MSCTFVEDILPVWGCLENPDRMFRFPWLRALLPGLLLSLLGLRSSLASSSAWSSLWLCYCPAAPSGVYCHDLWHTFTLPLILICCLRQILSFSHTGVYDGWLCGTALKTTDHECKVTCFQTQKSSVLHRHRINVQILN